MRREKINSLIYLIGGCILVLWWPLYMIFILEEGIPIQVVMQKDAWPYIYSFHVFGIIGYTMAGLHSFYMLKRINKHRKKEESEILKIRLGVVCFIIGNMLFAADEIIYAYVLPIFAEHHSELMSIHGVYFKSTFSKLFPVVYGIFSIVGVVLLCRMLVAKKIMQPVSEMLIIIGCLFEFFPQMVLDAEGAIFLKGIGSVILSAGLIYFGLLEGRTGQVRKNLKLVK